MLVLINYCCARDRIKKKKKVFYKWFALLQLHHRYVMSRTQPMLLWVCECIYRWLTFIHIYKTKLVCVFSVTCLNIKMVWILYMLLQTYKHTNMKVHKHKQNRYLMQYVIVSVYLWMIIFVCVYACCKLVHFGFQEFILECKNDKKNIYIFQGFILKFEILHFINFV